MTDYIAVCERLSYFTQSPQNVVYRRVFYVYRLMVQSVDPRLSNRPFARKSVKRVTTLKQTTQVGTICKIKFSADRLNKSKKNEFSIQNEEGTADWLS